MKISKEVQDREKQKFRFEKVIYIALEDADDHNLKPKLFEGGRHIGFRDLGPTEPRIYLFATMPTNKLTKIASFEFGDESCNGVCLGDGLDEVLLLKDEVPIGVVHHCKSWAQIWEYPEGDSPVAVFEVPQKVDTLSTEEFVKSTRVELRNKNYLKQKQTLKFILLHAIKLLNEKNS